VTFEINSNRHFCKIGCSRQVDILAEMNFFNIQGRYPDTLSPPPSQEEAQHYMTQGKEVFQWLISMF